jgi:polysaccharide deacetylase 2 family uncharacterized protein YibQ
MTSPDGLGNIRRDIRRGPSPLRHAIFAGLIIFSILATAYAVSIFLEKNAPRENISKVEITATQPVNQDINLPLRDAVETEDLPDLLAGDVAKDGNPTEALAGAQPEPLKADDAASAEERETPEAKPAPRIVRINGKPAGRDQAEPLIKAPIEGLSRQTPYGDIPAKSESGDTAFIRYAKPFRSAVNAKNVAIIIGGLGLNPEITTRAILDLPEEVTLSFAAHSPQLQNWINQARENGHEVLIEIPMETEGSLPNRTNRTLIVTDDIAANTRNLDWLLSRASGYFGVTNYNGDKFLSRSDLVAPMMSYLSNAGLSFVFDSSFEAIALPALATSAKLPFIETELVLDDVNNKTIIETNLGQLGEKARSGGSPIGIGFAYLNTIDAVTIWAAAAPEKGLVLVPASHLMAPE